VKQRIVLLGPPASGKGTQADRVASRFGIPHVSTGALLRSESARGTELGRKAESSTGRGLLVPDELVLRIIGQWIRNHGTRFIFDGFPRSVGQAAHLDAALAELQAPLDLIILLELSDEEIRRRVEARLSCLQCGATFSKSLHGLKIHDHCPHCGDRLVRRNDDVPEALEQRLHLYRGMTLPVVGYYERKVPHLMHRICAEEGSDAIFSKISTLVDEEGI